MLTWRKIESNGVSVKAATVPGGVLVKTKSSVACSSVAFIPNATLRETYSGAYDNEDDEVYEIVSAS